MIKNSIQSKVAKASRDFGPPNSLDKEREDLQSQNIQLESKLKKERLLWILVTLTLADFLLFRDLQNWAAPIVIGILEILIILFAAHQWGLDQIISLWNDLLKTFSRNNEGK